MLVRMVSLFRGDGQGNEKSCPGKIQLKWSISLASKTKAISRLNWNNNNNRRKSILLWTKRIALILISSFGASKSTQTASQVVWSFGLSEESSCWMMIVFTFCLMIGKHLCRWPVIWACQRSVIISRLAEDFRTHRKTCREFASEWHRMRRFCHQSLSTTSSTLPLSPALPTYLTPRSKQKLAHPPKKPPVHLSNLSDLWLMIAGTMRDDSQHA